MTFVTDSLNRSHMETFSLAQNCLRLFLVSTVLKTCDFFSCRNLLWKKIVGLVAPKKNHVSKILHVHKIRCFDFCSKTWILKSWNCFKIYSFWFSSHFPFEWLVRNFAGNGRGFKVGNTKSEKLKFMKSCIGALSRSYFEIKIISVSGSNQICKAV